MRGVRDMMGAFARVWMLISRLPLPRAIMPSVASLPDAADMCVFPLVGCVLGLVASLPAWALAHLLPMRPCAWLATACYLAAGWSLHIDGLGDLCDGLGSGRRGDAMRDVMKDSRVGSFAVCGVVICVALRSELLACAAVDRWLVVCAASAGLGRYAACAAAWRGTYPWTGGTAGDIVRGTGARELLFAAASAIPIGILTPELFAIGLPLAALCGAAVSSLAERTLGGTNGDVLGAASVAGELAVLAASLL